MEVECSSIWSHVCMYVCMYVYVCICWYVSKLTNEKVLFLNANDARFLILLMSIITVTLLPSSNEHCESSPYVSHAFMTSNILFIVYPLK
jgi:hypothetical protein